MSLMYINIIILMLRTGIILSSSFVILRLEGSRLDVTYNENVYVIPEDFRLSLVQFKW